MALDRRSLLAALAGTLAGCPRPRGDAAGSTATATPAATPTLAPDERVAVQSVTVENARAEPVYATLVVDPPRGEPFVVSRTLVPTAVVTFDAVTRQRGAHDVLVELASGERATYRWDVDGRLSGLSVTVHESLSFWPTARCGPDCRVAREGDAVPLPLFGDGSGYWFGPGAVVLRNPTSTVRTPRLRVTSAGDPVLDYRYAVPQGAQVVVPVSYRTGVYRVTVADGGVSRSDDWHVPQEPRQYVRLGDVAFHCGVESTTLRLANDDGVAHRLRLVVEGDAAGVRTVETYALGAGETKTVDPVDDSGRYAVTATTAAGATATGEWWACPPHAPTVVRIDATGDVAVVAPYRVG